MDYALIYLGAMGLLAFCLCGADKGRAARARRRISENTLLSIALLGGAAGLLLGMVVFRHKIRKPRFYLGVPAMLAFHGILLWYMAG